MKTIPLSNSNKAAIVDDDCFSIVSRLPWSSDRNGYAIGTDYQEGIQKTVIMHRMIMGLKRGDGLVVDHINHNTLDNQRSNLRVGSHRENMLNRRPKVFGPQLPVGVTRRVGEASFRARIHVNGKQVHLGRFKHIAPAAEAYRMAAAKYHPTDRAV